ncbi:hypothetical protein EV182_005224, partial [Spiromyces aspiralis]
MLSQDNVDPQYKLPRLLTFLVGLILKLKGMTCEGIFRVPGNQDLVSMLRVKLEAGDYNADGLTDPHVVASLLKEWLRELSEPLIPERLYEDCVANADNPGFIIGVVRKIPDVHQRAISFLIQLVQILTTPENEATTKMDINNLALVFAPSFLRHPRGNDLGDMMANTNVEQTFVCNLVKHWHAAASWKHPEVVKFLVESGADVNIADPDDDTPLHVCEDVACAEILLKHGANGLAKNKTGKT